MNHLPRAWTLIYKNFKSADNYEIIIIAVQFASQVIKWFVEDKLHLDRKTEQFTNIISHQDPPSFPSSKNDDPSFLTYNGSCYSCGRKVHRANECPISGNKNSGNFSSNNHNNHKLAHTWNRKKRMDSSNKYSELCRKLSRFRNFKQLTAPNANRETQRSHLFNIGDC